jgi:hypothetical protein
VLYKKCLLKKKVKSNGKHIYTKTIIVIICLLFLSTTTYLLHTTIEQFQYESRVMRNDGKLYPSENSISLVQRVVNTPTHESNNMVINLTQYFYRSYMILMPWNNMAQIYCCELIERSKTPPYFVWTENEGANHEYEIIEQNDDRMIIDVKSHYLGYDTEQETYFTIVKTDVGWRIDKYRVLVSGNSLYTYVNNPADTPPEFIDENTQQTYLVSLESAKLAIRSDAQLIEYFKQNKEKFYELMNFNNINQNLVNNLNLTTVIRNYNNYCLTCTFFIIGGSKDDTVGYFFLSNKSKLPKIDGHSLIIIREIGNGWYFYKGT